MAWMSGLAECYPLGATCVIDWSAVATAAAAIIALFVGVAPIVLQGQDRRRKGMAKARMAVATMEIQALSLEAVIQMCKGEMSGAEYNEVMNTSKCLDIDMARGLVDYIDVFKPATRSLIVDCATRTDTVLRAQRRELKVKPSVTVHSNGYFGIYEMYLSLLLRCQLALAEETGLTDACGQYHSAVPDMLSEIRRRAALEWVD